MRKKSKTMHSLTMYVVFSIAVVIVYSIAEFITSTITGVQHDILTGCIFGFFCGEVTLSGLIKIHKLKGVNT